MFNQKFIRCFLVILLLLNIGLHSKAHADDTPTVFFYVAYIFEAKTNGEEITFPILPGEIAISTIDNVLETTEGYIEKLRSIYAFKHFTTLTTLGHAIYLEKSSKEYGIITNPLLREKQSRLDFSLLLNTIQGSDMLSARIEMSLKKYANSDGKIKPKESVPILKTLCTVKHNHPLVIGRLMESEEPHKRAIFIVFTPFFHRLTHQSQYEEVIATYKRVMKLTPGSGDLGGWNVFKKINHYFKTNLKKQNILPLDKIVPPPPPPKPFPNEEGAPLFFAYDEAPVPIGGWQELQRNLAYPATARKSGIEGKVVVNVEIDENGVVGKTWILISLPGGCDEAAVDAVRKTKWKPALSQDKPVKVRVAVTLVFKLN